MIRVGGVPENVNVPWYVAIESGELSDTVEWIDCPGGTGEMTKKLAERELDVALVLTEGIIAHIANGGDARIVGTYVDSPLIWGVHTAHGSTVRSIDDLRGGRFAVSRFGSGSHLMAFVLASQQNWSAKEVPKIVVAGGLAGALDMFADGSVDGFLWEKYMTKPLVDDGTLRRVGECRAPWPAFSIAATPEAMEQYDLRRLLGVVGQSVAFFEAQHDRLIEEIEARFELDPVDIRAWIAETQFACVPSASESTIDDAIAFLKRIDVVKTDLSYKEVVAEI